MDMGVISLTNTSHMIFSEKRPENGGSYVKNRIMQHNLP